jgi:hypothetical protein
MNFKCFLDDSKDQNQSKLLVSAGFLGLKEDWHRLTAEWKRALKKHGLRYFKTSEYKMLDGEFARFKSRAFPPPTGRQAASAIRSELQGVLRRNPRILGVGIAIPVEDYARVCSRPDAQGIFPGDPYQRALEGVLLEAVKLAKMVAGEDVRIGFVHDDGPDSALLRSVYEGFKVANPRTATHMDGFRPLCDRKNPPLQLADMVANFTLVVGLDWLTNGRQAKWATEMESNIGKLGVWTEHVMLSILKRNLIRRNRPVPVDLQGSEYG